MKIGIEAHTIEKNERLGAGGNYLLEILKEWSNLDPNQYQFILYFKDRIPTDEFLNKPIFKKRITKIFGINSTMLFYNLLFPLRAVFDKLDVLFLPFYMRPFFCFNSKIITSIHDIFFKPHPEWCSWRYRYPYLILTKLAVKSSKAIIVCSESTKKEIIKYYKVDSNKIRVVYLAAGEEFNPIKDVRKIEITREKYTLNKKYLFFAGTILNRRHVLESIQAFEKLLEKGLDYQFLISGRDFTRCPRQNIDKEVERINSKFSNAIKRIKYIDNEDLVSIYQGAELFIWPSEYEGFGLPILEAMACGTPVLTTKMTSLKEVLGDYPIAVDNPSNVGEIKEKIMKILNDEKLKNEMIQKGLERAKSFSWQKTAQETLKSLISL